MRQKVENIRAGSELGGNTGAEGLIRGGYRHQSFLSHAVSSECRGHLELPWMLPKICACDQWPLCARKMFAQQYVPGRVIFHKDVRINAENKRRGLDNKKKVPKQCYKL